MNKEIDLSEYIGVIVRRWKLVVGLMVVCVLAAGIASFLLPPVYEARAGVLIRTQQEETEDDQKEWVALAEGGSVATLVIDRLGDTLPQGERNANALLAKVITQTRGDLVLIKVRDRDPKKATAIANAWGEAYEGYVNELYGTSSQSAQDIGAEADEAKRAYDGAQEELIRFKGDNRIEILTREIDARQKTLDDYYATKRVIDRLIANAKALRGLLGEDSSSMGVASDLSILLLKAKAFALLVPDLPEGVLLSLDQVTDRDSTIDEQRGDLDTLIAVLEAQQQEVKTLIEEMSLQSEILKLQEELAREEAREEELTRARELAWNTYEALANRVAKLSAEGPDTEARLAVRAVEPNSPVAPKKKSNIVMGGVLGLVVGIIGAFGVEYLQRSSEEDSPD